MSLDLEVILILIVWSAYQQVFCDFKSLDIICSYVFFSLLFLKKRFNKINEHCSVMDINKVTMDNIAYLKSIRESLITLKIYEFFLVAFFLYPMWFND